MSPLAQLIPLISLSSSCSQSLSSCKKAWSHQNYSWNNKILVSLRFRITRWLASMQSNGSQHWQVGRKFRVTGCKVPCRHSTFELFIYNFLVGISPHTTHTSSLITSVSTAEIQLIHCHQSESQHKVVTLTSWWWEGRCSWEVNIPRSCRIDAFIYNTFSILSTACIDHSSADMPSKLGYTLAGIQ